MKSKNYVPIIMLISLTLISGSHIAQENKENPLPQFLYPEFSTGVVRMKNGTVQTASMNYNTLTEKIVFMRNDRMLELTGLEKVDTVILRDTRFVPVGKVFYEIIVNAPIALFIQNKSNLQSAGSPSGYGTTSQTIGPTSVSKLYAGHNTYNLKLSEDFKLINASMYWIRKNNEMHMFITKRQFEKIFPGKEKMIRKFIDENKINFSDKNDLKTLVNYCSGIEN